MKDYYLAIRTFLLINNLKEDEKIVFIMGIPHIRKKSKWELRLDKFLKLFKRQQNEYCDKCMKHSKQLKHCYDCNKNLCSKCWGIELRRLHECKA